MVSAILPLPSKNIDFMLYKEGVPIDVCVCKEMERQLISMKVQHQSLQKQHAFSKQQLHRVKVLHTHTDLRKTAPCLTAEPPHTNTSEMPSRHSPVSRH